MNPVKIRKAENKDKKDILKIISELSLDIPQFIWDKDEFIKRQIENGEYFLADFNGKIAGIISLKRKNKTIFIETLAVLSEHRLKKIGSQLVDLAENFTRAQGIKKICACSFFEYKIGDFYLKKGFHLLEKPGIYNGHKYHIFIKNI